MRRLTKSSIAKVSNVQFYAENEGCVNTGCTNNPCHNNGCTNAPCNNKACY